MATEMSFEDYYEKYSVFNKAERAEILKQERTLIAINPQAIFRFWAAKREQFIQRLNILFPI